MTYVELNAGISRNGRFPRDSDFPRFPVLSSAFSHSPRPHQMTGASAEEFHVQVLSADPRPVDVLLGVNLDGLVLTDKSQANQPHRIELQEINKWSLRDGRLLLYTRPSSASGGDDVVVLLGSTYTLRSVLDALTSCCMQLAPVAQGPFVNLLELYPRECSSTVISDFASGKII